MSHLKVVFFYKCIAIHLTDLLNQVMATTLIKEKPKL